MMNSSRSDFHKIGGYRILLPCLASPHTSLRRLTGELIATLMQNNPYCQAMALQEAVLPALLKAIEEDADAGARSKALHALSCNRRRKRNSICFFWGGGNVTFFYDDDDETQVWCGAIRARGRRWRPRPRASRRCCASSSRATRSCASRPPSCSRTSATRSPPSEVESDIIGETAFPVQFQFQFQLFGNR